MPRSLMSLAIGAIDSLGQVLSQQELLRICLDEFNNPSEITQKRVELLLVCYFSSVESHFEELDQCLEEIRQQLGYHPPD